MACAAVCRSWREVAKEVVIWLCRRAGRRIPEKILDHDRVIWLGDLNYRISLSYEDTKKLLTENNWDALFEKDQLNIERNSGRVFKGWSEEKIYFAPTYKYSCNSDSYARILMPERLQHQRKRGEPQPGLENSYLT